MSIQQEQVNPQPLLTADRVIYLGPENIPCSIFAAHEQLLNGALEPATAGLTMPDQTWLYTQERVAGWQDGTVETGTIFKLTTMLGLTATGEEFVGMLKAAGMSTKEASAWRIIHPLLRATSLDELPQLWANVLGINVCGIPAKEFKNRLSMRLVGSARPVLPEEIAYKGDNANDRFGRALELVAKERGYDSDRDLLYKELAKAYKPALLTPATARGVRQLNDEWAVAEWIRAILTYAQIDTLPRGRRARALGRIVMASAKHVVLRADAA